MLLSLVSVKMKCLLWLFEAIFLYNPYFVKKSDLVELDA